MTQDRKSQIFAPFIKVGGVVKPMKQKPVAAANLSSTISSLKEDITPTILKTCTYRTGSGVIYNYDPAKIESIRKGKKHVCFLVTGEPTTMSQEDAIKSMPVDIEDSIRRLSNQADNNEEAPVEQTENVD